MSSFILIIMSSVLLMISGQQRDDLCPRMSSVLCVKDVLLDISSATKEINGITHQIEQSIYTREPNRISLDRYVDHVIKHIRSNVSSIYHYQFVNVHNNLNRSGLIDLIKEEHYAFSVLYHSINNLFKLENRFSNSMDKFFRKILIILRKNILCHYRNILYVYSETWLTMNEIKGIQIIETRKSSALSFFHGSYSIIVTRLLQEWIRNVKDFVDNVENKHLPCDF